MDAPKPSSRNASPRSSRRECLVNLGIGIPTLRGKLLYRPACSVFFQSENGLIGTGAVPEDRHGTCRRLTDAGGQTRHRLAGR